MKIIAHRGCGTLAKENTLEAIEKAIELGFDETEIDVRESKDGKLIVFHDQTTDRITEEKHYVKDLTLRQLQSFVKEKIPVLDEVMSMVKGRISLRIDLKSNSAEKIVQAIEKNQVKDVVVISRDKETLTKIKELKQDIEVGPLVTEPGIDALQLAKESNSDCIHLGRACVNEQIISEAKKLGLKVAIGDYDTPEEITKAIKFDVDAITSDRPDLLRDALK